MIKNLIVIGNDKISGKVVKKIFNDEECIIYVDKSTGISRVIRLLLANVISPFLIMKMLVSELLRKGHRPDIKFLSIRHNDDLLRVISKHKPARLILFRAGLIINKSVLEAGVPILNIHAAMVPDYGGIGSISRAIKDGAYDQYASLHVVTAQIDKGEVIDKVSYRLNPHFSYCQNEAVAYRAAQQLFLKTIHGKEHLD